MKLIVRALLCFALLTTLNRAAAQETFAPLISENCVAFVHADFSKVEIDTVKNTLQKTGEALLKELGFDDESLKATARELTVELEKLDVLVRPPYETITKELGIKEFAVILDMEIILTGQGAGVIAIPWKNKTDKQFETLLNLFDVADKSGIDMHLFKTGDFLMLAIAQGTEGTKVVEATVKGWLAKPASANAPILEALKSVSAAEIKIAAAIPEQARLMVRNAPMPPDVPLEVRNLLLFAANKIEWISASASLHDFLGKEAPKNADVLLTVKTPKKSDADMLRNMLESSIELGVNSARFMMEQEMRNADFQIPPVAFQFAKGLLRTLLPDVEEDKLIFRAKGKGGPVAVTTVGVGVALLLPAVQASREAARRMQCANHIKQITLALHVYHDIHNAFPPLYTVDQNGKPLHSWRVLILPYMEQTALYQQIRLEEPWNSEYNKQFHDRVVAVYRCPTNGSVHGGSGYCTYSVIAGEVFVPGKGNNFAAIADGTSNTIAIVEVKEPFCWMDPTADVTLDELVKGINKGRVGSFHPGGINVGMCDGSVRFVSDRVDTGVLRALGTRAGGESVHD